MRGKHVFVICAYGASPYLEACIGSLLKQKTEGGMPEMMISTSTPGAYISSAAEKYDIPVLVRQTESSHSVSRIAEDWNFAIACGRKAGADYVTLAHQDDIYDPEYRASVLKAAEEAENNGENPQIIFSDYYEIRKAPGTTREVGSAEKALGENTGTNAGEKGESFEYTNRNLSVKRRLLFLLKSHYLRRTRWGKRSAIRFGNAICCPAVTYVCRNIPEDPFKGSMGSNIDWQLWEELSKQKGSFVYIPRPLMGHRIHAGSTTTELIENSGRSQEDLYMLRQFWPEWIARMIERAYRRGENSNRV